MSRLTVSDFALLSPNLVRIELPLRTPLEMPNRAIEFVYFIEQGFASIVAGRGDYAAEVGLVGREGVTGTPVILGAGSSPNSTYIQLAGRGLRLPAVALRDAMEESASLRVSLLRHCHSSLVQASQTALANASMKVDARLARWLLMANDRVDGNEVRLTHELLALMLGARRAGVTVAMKALERKELVSVRRGAITIRDRKALESMTRGAYSAPAAEAQRHVD